MAITYPLTFPEIDGKTIIEKITMRHINSVAVTQSPFNYKQQVQDYGGVRWEAEVTIRPLTHTEAKTFNAFISSCKGSLGTFKMGNPLDVKTVDNATAVFQSAHSEGDNAINVSFTGSARILVGEYISIANHLHLVLNRTAVGGGESLDIIPPLRQSAVTGQTVVTDEPVGLWRLASNQTEWNVSKNLHYSFTFSCVEDI